MNINLLTPLTNQYLSCFDTVDNQAAMETALLAINETIVAVNKLKGLLKEQSTNIGIANLLSIALEFSNVSKDIKEISCQIESY